MAAEQEAIMLRHALVMLLVAAPVLAFAQAEGLTLQEVKRKYPKMNVVHINKCDYDGNEIFTKTEMLCVAGIYQQMYIDRH